MTLHEPMKMHYYPANSHLSVIGHFPGSLITNTPRNIHRLDLQKHAHIEFFNFKDSKYLRSHSYRPTSNFQGL